MKRQSMDSDVVKSMHMMESKLNTPQKNILRMSRQPWTLPGRQSTAFDRPLNLNESIDKTMMFSMGDSAMTGAKLTDLSMTFFDGELTGFVDTGMQNVTMLKGKEPWEDVGDRLFLEFLETVQSRGSGQLFETLNDIIQTCTDTLGLINDMKFKDSKKKMSSILSDDWSLEDERNTWRLLYCLYESRANRALGSDRMDIDVASRRHPVSEKDAADQLYKEDPVTYEYQLIIDWLEKNALDQQEDGDGPRPEFFTDKTVAWENTLHQLQNKRDHIPYKSSRDIVEHIDPDAPLREGKPLHDLDIEDEVRLTKQVFAEIRCGRLEQAQSLCEHCGQPWRAATLEGWQLHHDPNYTVSPATDEKLPVEGNPMRDLWKRCSWQMSLDGRVSPFERAAQAALCGNVSAVLPACHSWADQLWARLRGAVDVRVERAVRAAVLRSYTDMPDSYWQNDLPLSDIFAELASSKERRVRDEATQPFATVQQLLMADDIPRLMREMEAWLAQGRCGPQMTRFLAHLVMMLRQLDRGHRADVGDKVLEEYVKVLTAQGNPRLVSHYVSALPPGDQVRWYASYLAGIQSLDERKACLAAAEEAGLDVQAITKAVVENIRHQTLESGLPDLKAAITAEDLAKISALDWVVFYPSQRAEALWQSNGLVRTFLACGKVEAARKALNKIPGDSIEMVLKQHPSRLSSCEPAALGFQHLPPKVAAAIREHLCHRTYLDAQESFTDWFEHFHNAKPTAPAKPKGSEATFTERVAFDHRQKAYESDLERWKVSMNIQTKMAKQRLYNVLLFPDGGWLVDSTGPSEPIPDDDNDSGRTQQMENLRQLCIPNVVLLLHSVMHGMSEFAESVQLAEIIVSEQHQLYRVYTKQKLAELLTKLSESSLAVMDGKKDAFGYQI